MSTDGRRSPKLSAKECKEEDTQKGKAPGRGTEWGGARSQGGKPSPQDHGRGRQRTEKGA